jgi:hypothetical protein
LKQNGNKRNRQAMTRDVDNVGRLYWKPRSKTDCSARKKEEKYAYKQTNKLA